MIHTLIKSIVNLVVFGPWVFILGLIIVNFLSYL